jgi:glutathione S-transferase
MTQPVVLYYNPNSRARVVHWLLEEIGVPYRIELLRFDRQQHKRPEYLRLNPMGKVPCIVDHETVVTECGAICVYLADNYPRAQLAPALHDPARASYLRWLFFAAGCVEPALVDHMFERSPVPPRSIGYGSYEDVLNAMELALTPGPYILGDRFSAADVYLGSEIAWGALTKALEPRARFAEYAERLADRPAYKRFSAHNRTLSAQLAQESAA